MSKRVSRSGAVPFCRAAFGTVRPRMSSCSPACPAALKMDVSATLSRAILLSLSPMTPRSSDSQADCEAGEAHNTARRFVSAV